ncbi:iron uptake system protein EfeO [Rhodococcus sp. X156]|uniref:iron uptake system protein EfeO n=1 Tax=Rhodococcus sp. X156 TaxID=2499145 RepID=UPI0019D24D83|nr:iron uptake system protein EfeO [Rhodococcus sp. X156]
MPRTPLSRPLSLATALVLVPLALAGCTAKAGSSAHGVVSVKAGDSSCEVSTTSASTGNTTFEVTNTGSKTTEFYLYAEGDRIMGEVENISPGLSRRLIVEVPQAGSYTTACKPGMVGDGIRGDFLVSGDTVQGDTDTKLDDATDSYQRYVNSQADALTAKTAEFVVAVKAGDVALAKTLYPVARTYWERIEPVAESFGDLDPITDGREDALEPGQELTGWHRLERDLWRDGLQPDSVAMADQLQTNVNEVSTRARTVELSALEMANGAKALLDEVATGKVTGEEEAYSHTDLWDFRANIDGSEAAIASLRPVLQERNPDLVPTLDARFAAVDQALTALQAGDGYVLYDQLTPEQVKDLSDKVDALAEPLSSVAGTVAE